MRLFLKGSFVVSFPSFAMVGSGVFEVVLFVVVVFVVVVGIEEEQEEGVLL